MPLVLILGAFVKHAFLTLLHTEQGPAMNLDKKAVLCCGELQPMEQDTEYEVSDQQQTEGLMVAEISSTERMEEDMAQDAPVKEQVIDLTGYNELCPESAKESTLPQVRGEKSIEEITGSDYSDLVEVKQKKTVDVPDRQNHEKDTAREQEGTESEQVTKADEQAADDEVFVAHSEDATSKTAEASSQTEARPSLRTVLEEISTEVLRTEPEGASAAPSYQKPSRFSFRNILKKGSGVDEVD